MVNNHILPLSHQEINCVFYGNLWKYFSRVQRFKVVVQGEGQGCEVILEHSLVCRKSNKEFIIDGGPDLALIHRLADHVAQIDGSVSCIFCNAQFPRKELRLHFSDHCQAIATALRYFKCNLNVSETLFSKCSLIESVLCIYHLLRKNI